MTEFQMIRFSSILLNFCFILLWAQLLNKMQRERNSVEDWHAMLFWGKFMEFVRVRVDEPRKLAYKFAVFNTNGANVHRHRITYN